MKKMNVICFLFFLMSVSSLACSQVPDDSKKAITVAKNLTEEDRKELASIKQRALRCKTQIELANKVFETQAKGDVFELPGPWLYDDSPRRKWIIIKNMFRGPTIHQGKKVDKAQQVAWLKSWMKGQRKGRDFLPPGTKVQLVSCHYRIYYSLGNRRAKIQGYLRFKILNGKYKEKIVRYSDSVAISISKKYGYPYKNSWELNKPYYRTYQDKDVRYKDTPVTIYFFCDDMKFIGKQPIENNK